MGADVTPFSHIVARRRRGRGKGVCPLASHLFIHTYVHAHNVSVHTVPIKCCRWNGASGVAPLMEFELQRLPPQSKTVRLWTFQQGGWGRRRGQGKVVCVHLAS